MDRVVRVWTVTLGLLFLAIGSVGAVLATGGDTLLVGAGVVFVGYLSALSWQSGGRFEFETKGGRPLGPEDPPEIRRALLAVCDRAGRPVPDPVVVEMDVPGAFVGYDGGEPAVAVDPRLLWIIGPEGLEAILAHELGHLGTDLHTDAVRKYLPQVIGFGAFWVVFLAGRGPAVAAAGSALYAVLALVGDRRAVWVRFALSLGVEAVTLAASRYANRQEEHLADEFAVEVVSPDAVTEALYRIAAIATGDNDEDVAGPVPWNADRNLWFALFATHPTIESRVEALGSEIPDWVQPYRPHRKEAA